MMNRSDINRALAKALAYHEAGNGRMASVWAFELTRLLDAAGILIPAAAPPPYDLEAGKEARQC